MAQKPRKSTRAPSSPAKRPPADDVKALAVAIKAGQGQAAEVFERRVSTHKRRKAAVKRHVEAARKVAGREPAIAASAFARASVGTLVAEGDSWFDYPLYDVLKNLDDTYGYDVESVAHKGDAVENMAYGPAQLDEFSRALERLLRRGVTPRAILLSGGGNDVAGDTFAMLINHRQSPVPGLNASVLQGVLQQRIRYAYATILSAITQLCVRYLGQPVPVLVHGYAYPVPDGRGFLGGWGPLPGPWLEPGFTEKGYDVLAERVIIAAQLIDAFNDMISGLAGQPPFAHVRYIDLRPELSNQTSDYKKWWGNEMHPTSRGFDAVTARFAQALASLP